jgi:hypothetical protein
VDTAFVFDCLALPGLGTVPPGTFEYLLSQRGQLLRKLRLLMGCIGPVKVMHDAREVRGPEVAGLVLVQTIRAWCLIGPLHEDHEGACVRPRNSMHALLCMHTRARQRFEPSLTNLTSLAQRTHRHGAAPHCYASATHHAAHARTHPCRLPPPHTHTPNHTQHTPQDMELLSRVLGGGIGSPLFIAPLVDTQVGRW